MFPKVCEDDGFHVGFACNDEISFSPLSDDLKYLEKEGIHLPRQPEKWKRHEDARIFR